MIVIKQDCKFEQKVQMVEEFMREHGIGITTTPRTGGLAVQCLKTEKVFPIRDVENFANSEPIHQFPRAFDTDRLENVYVDETDITD